MKSTKICYTTLTIKDREVLESDLFNVWRGLDRDYERFAAYLKLRREETPCSANHLHHTFQMLWFKYTKNYGHFTGCLASVINYTNNSKRT